MLSNANWMDLFFLCSIGAVIGFLIARVKLGRIVKECKLAKQKLAAAEFALKNYKEKVSQHFCETATLINEMTAQYQNVHEHLRKGADDLCSFENPPEFNLENTDSSKLKTNKITQDNCSETGVKDEDFLYNSPKDYLMEERI